MNYYTEEQVAKKIDGKKISHVVFSRGLHLYNPLIEKIVMEDGTVISFTEGAQVYSID